MRKNFGKQSWVYPAPVLIIGTYNDDDRANAMNAAWGSSYDTNQIFICLSSDHQTTENIVKRKAFTVSFATENTLVASDYVGIASGKEIDKISKCGWTAKKSENVDAPYFEELPVTLECKVVRCIDENGTTYLVGDIVNITADESVLNDAGRIDPSKLKAICFSAFDAGYYVIEKRVGNAFKDGMKIK